MCQARWALSTTNLRRFVQLPGRLHSVGPRTVQAFDHAFYLFTLFRRRARHLKSCKKPVASMRAPVSFIGFRAQTINWWQRAARDVTSRSGRVRWQRNAVVRMRLSCPLIASCMKATRSCWTSGWKAGEAPFQTTSQLAVAPASFGVYLIAVISSKKGRKNAEIYDSGQVRGRKRHLEALQLHRNQ